MQNNHSKVSAREHGIPPIRRFGITLVAAVVLILAVVRPADAQTKTARGTATAVTDVSLTVKLGDRDITFDLDSKTSTQLSISVTVDGPEDALSGSGWTIAPPPPLPAVPVAPIFFTQAGSVTGSLTKLVGRGLFSPIVGCVGAEITVTADLADGFITFSCMCVDPAVPEWRFDGIGTVVHD